MSGEATDPCNRQINSGEPQDDTQRYNNTFTNLHAMYDSLTYSGIELCFYFSRSPPSVQTPYRSSNGQNYFMYGWKGDLVFDSFYDARHQWPKQEEQENMFEEENRPKSQR